MNKGKKLRPGVKRDRKQLTTLPGILGEMGRIYRGMKAGRINADKGRSLVWVLDRMRASVADIALEQVERKIAEIVQTANGHDQIRTLMIEHDDTEQQPEPVTLTN